MHALTREGNEHVSRESRCSNRGIVRVSGDSSKLHEMNPRKHRAASHKVGACASRMRCASTPHLARNTQTKHPGMARFARRA